METDNEKSLWLFQQLPHHWDAINKVVDLRWSGYVNICTLALDVSQLPELRTMSTNTVAVIDVSFCCAGEGCPPVLFPAGATVATSVMALTLR